MLNHRIMRQPAGMASTEMKQGRGSNAAPALHPSPLGIAQTYILVGTKRDQKV